MEYCKRKDNPIYSFWKILWAFSFSTGIMALIISFFSLTTGFEGMTPPLTYALIVFALAIALPLYSLPAFFAHRKRMEKRKSLTLCNFFLGWTLIGYILCAVSVAKGGKKQK